MRRFHPLTLATTLLLGIPVLGFGAPGVAPVVTTNYLLDKVTITFPGGGTELVDTTVRESDFYVENLGSDTAIVHLDFPPIDGEFSVLDELGKPFVTFEMRDGFVVPGSIVQTQRLVFVLQHFLLSPAGGLTHTRRNSCGKIIFKYT